MKVVVTAFQLAGIEYITHHFPSIIPIMNMRRFLSVLLMTTLLVSGCSRFEFQTKGSKPTSAKSAAAKQDTCPAPFASGTLITRLDDTLAKTAETQHWPKTADQCKSRFPYDFKIVSVQPPIVIGIPKTMDEVGCSPISEPLNCLKSSVFDGSYEIATQFKHSTQLVWFSPDHGPRLFKVPSHAKSMFLMIGGHSFRMRRQGDTWRVLNK